MVVPPASIKEGSEKWNRFIKKGPIKTKIRPITVAMETALIAILRRWCGSAPLTRSAKTMVTFIGPIVTNNSVNA